MNHFYWRQRVLYDSIFLMSFQISCFLIFGFCFQLWIDVSKTDKAHWRWASGSKTIARGSEIGAWHFIAFKLQRTWSAWKWPTWSNTSWTWSMFERVTAISCVLVFDSNSLFNCFSFFCSVLLKAFRIWCQVIGSSCHSTWFQCHMVKVAARSVASFCSMICSLLQASNDAAVPLKNLARKHSKSI